MNRETKTALTKVVDKLERTTNKNALGYGEHVCQFCDAHGHTNLEHKEGCPIGDLWSIINGH